MMGAGWMERAACRGRDPDWWSADPGTAAERAAVAVCAGCPVQRPCLAAGLESPWAVGVWGGLNESQRRRMRQARRAAQ